MNLHSQIKVKGNVSKIVGRGIGSGKGKTAARGYKGQKARGKVPASFTGGGLPLYKKLPYKRGWGNSKVSEKPAIVTFEDLNALKAKSTVNISSLIESGIIKPKDTKRGVKILNKGELKVSLTVELPVSKSARAAIEKLGGKVG